MSQTCMLSGKSFSCPGHEVMYEAWIYSSRFIIKHLIALKVLVGRSDGGGEAKLSTAQCLMTLPPVTRPSSEIC